MTRDDRLTDKREANRRYPSFSALKEAHTNLQKWSGDASNDPRFLDEVEEFVKKGRETGALLDARDDRSAAQSLLNYWAILLDRSGRELPEATLEDFDPTLFPELRDEDCPYLGLDAFREKNRGVFFGRQSRIREMIDHLKEKRLLAVVGLSGSGKSSIVLAGLVPKLKDGAIEGSEKWHYYRPVVPGSNPLRNVASVIGSEAGQSARSTEQETRNLGESPSHLIKMMEGLEGVGVLIIDQFEEIFTLCQDDAIRRAFITYLQRVLDQPEPRHRVILTMRSDFEELLPRLSEFYSLFESSKFDLPPMSASELREAIEEPAKLVGLRFEEGVVDALLRDLLGEPAGLPLLQFTLLKLWDNRQRNRVTMDAYRRLGGGRQALERSAEEFYGQLLPEDQNRARYIFMRMVRPREKGLEVTSERIQRKTLYPTRGERKAIDQVLDKLVASRLVRLTKGDKRDDDQLEVAHEALVRNWDRLDEWVRSEREKIRSRIRLTSAAEQWKAVKRDRGALLRGVLLEEALHYEDLNALEREYVEASRIEVEREQERWRELAEQAERQARIATARQLAAQSQITRYSHRSLLLALEALHVTQWKDEPRVPAAEEALRRALANARGRGLGKYHKDRITVVAMVPDNRRLVTCSADKTIRIWDLTKPIPGAASKVLRGHEGEVTSITVSPDGHWLVSGSTDMTVRVWDLSSSDPMSSSYVLRRFQYSIRVVAISPNGRWLTVGTEESVIYRWDLHDLAAPPREMRGHVWGIRGIAFSADGLWMLSGGDDDTARLWDLRNDGSGPVPLEGFGDKDAVWGVSVTPDSKWLAAGSVKGKLHVWEWREAASRPELRAALRPNQRSITAMTVTPDSQWLITGGSDSSVKLWNFADLSADPIVLPGHEDWISAAVVSSDGRWLITGSGDNTARLWDLKNSLPSQPQSIVVLRGHELVVRSAAISKDSRLAATCSNDGSVQLVELTNPAQMPAPRVFDGSRAPSAISFDGHWLATSSESNTILLWDLTAPAGDFHSWPWNGSYIRTIAISPDGRWLVAGSERPQLFVLDLADPAALFPFELSRGAYGIRSIAFSADSRWLACGGDDHDVRLWDFADMGAGPRFFWGAEKAISAVAISPDQRWLVAGDWNGDVRVWDLTDPPAWPRVLRKHREERGAPIWALRISPDSRWLVTAGREDPTAWVWDLKDADAAPVQLSGHGKWVTSMAISPDSRRLVTVSEDPLEDPLVRVWDLADLSADPLLLRGHEWGMRSVCISSDNRLLVTGSDDKTVRIWQMDDLAENPIVLQGHKSAVTELAITLDNNWLMTASPYDTTCLWSLRLEDLINQACYLAGRNFSLDEWEQYFPKQDYHKTCDDFPVPYEVIEHEFKRADLLVKRQDLHGAAEAYRRASEWAVETDDADLNRKIGRRGCTAGFAKIVLPACERAVVLDPTNGDCRDTRGIARALTEDYSGAIEDFQYYLTWAKAERAENIVAKREAWLKELNEGRNPLDPSVLSELAEEEQADA
jgi:WD40 repeat protein